MDIVGANDYSPLRPLSIQSDKILSILYIDVKISRGWFDRLTTSGKKV